MPYGPRDAGIVLVNPPQGLAGGVAAAALDAEGLWVAGLVGFVTLLGIITRNGIMLVAHKRQLDAEAPDSDLVERVLRAARERLLPIPHDGRGRGPGVPAAGRPDGGARQRAGIADGHHRGGGPRDLDHPQHARPAHDLRVAGAQGQTPGGRTMRHTTLAVILALVPATRALPAAPLSLRDAQTEARARAPEAAELEARLRGAELSAEAASRAVRSNSILSGT